MNFDMNVFMNALQAGFGAANTVKTQAPQEQKEENLWDNTTTTNQTQQQVVQDQQSMGFFAMVGMMFLGFLSLFGFGNNANNNVNNNTNAGNNAAVPTEKPSVNQPEKKDIDELQDMFHEAMGAEAKLAENNVSVDVENAYQKDVAGFTPRESTAVRYLTVAEIQSTPSNKSANYNPNDEFSDIGKMAYVPGKVYYEGADGKIHDEWANPTAKTLDEKIEEASSALSAYQLKHPKSNTENDSKFKILFDDWNNAVNMRYMYNEIEYSIKL